MTVSVTAASRAARRPRLAAAAARPPPGARPGTAASRRRPLRPARCRRSTAAAGAAMARGAEPQVISHLGEPAQRAGSDRVAGPASDARTGGHRQQRRPSQHGRRRECRDVQHGDQDQHRDERQHDRRARRGERGMRARRADRRRIDRGSVVRLERRSSSDQTPSSQCVDRGDLVGVLLACTTCRLHLAATVSARRSPSVKSRRQDPEHLDRLGLGDDAPALAVARPPALDLGLAQASGSLAPGRPTRRPVFRRGRVASASQVGHASSSMVTSAAMNGCRSPTTMALADQRMCRGPGPPARPARRSCRRR